MGCRREARTVAAVLLPRITPAFGHSLDHVQRTLIDLHTDVHNLPGSNGLINYQSWANKAADALGHIVSSESIEYLVQTQRHWVLMAAIPTTNLTNINGMVLSERADRLRVFESLITQYRSFDAAWKDVDARVVAIDTNVFLHHENDFTHTYWCDIADSERVRLLVPMQVVRELDKAKTTQTNETVSETNSEKIRIRVTRTSRMLRERFADVNAVVKLRPGIDIELVLDTRDHQWMEDGDSEIVDRLAAAEMMIRRPIAIATYDGGMQFSARAARLEVLPFFEATVGLMTVPPSPTGGYSFEIVSDTGGDEWFKEIFYCVFPLFSGNDEESNYVGTCFTISAGGQFVTARHVARELIKDWTDTYHGAYPAALFMTPVGNVLVPVKGFNLSSDDEVSSDLATGQLDTRGSDGQPLPVPFPQVSREVAQRPIVVGQRVACVGHTQTDEQAFIDPETGLFSRTGTLTVIYDEIVEVMDSRGNLPAPTFRLDREMPGGMSGGPIFDEETSELIRRVFVWPSAGQTCPVLLRIGTSAFVEPLWPKPQPGATGSTVPRMVPPTSRLYPRSQAETPLTPSQRSAQRRDPTR